MRELAPQRLALRAIQLFLIAILALCLFLALVVPYHATDALVYGQWSRLIGAHGGFFFDAAGFTPYARPLFYAPQGWTWWLVGGHEWLGRLASLAFFGLLLWSIFRLARDRSLPPVTPWLALILLFACPDVVQQALAGQTDVPVAAMIALAGVLAWRFPPRWSTAALIAVAAASAVLAKSTALPALLGLAAAMVLGDRASLRERLRFSVVPIIAGMAVGLLYDVVMARHFALTLNGFLSNLGPSAADNGAAAAEQAPSAASRLWDAIDLIGDPHRDGLVLSADWVGPYLRLLAIYGVVYALARVATVAHRTAAFLALGVGLVGYWLGPAVLPGGDGFLGASGGALLGSLLLTVPLAAVAWCPPEQQASRLLLARLAVWSIPPFVAWALLGILTDTRTLSPTWPALFVLLAAIAAMGVSGLGTRRVGVAAAAMVLLLGLALLDFRNLDGLGSRPDGSINSLRALRELTPSTWMDPAAARIAADPQLGGLVADTRGARPAGGRVWSNDGRMIFYFLDQTHVAQPPSDCAGLRGYSVLSVLLNVAGPFDAAGYRCLTPVRVVPGSYAVYRVAG